MAQEPYLPPQALQQAPEFFNHPFIRSIANTPCWTISGHVNDTDKCPIDIAELYWNHRVIGCSTKNKNSSATLYQTLDVINRINPGALPANHAFNMDTLRDNFVLIDVEPECPDELKQKFLQLPCIYMEKSMSGKGIHIVMPVPEEYKQSEEMKELTKLQANTRYYEVMFCHWVTFTRNIIHQTTVAPDDSFFHKILKGLWAEHKTTIQYSWDGSDTNNLNNIDPYSIPGAKEMLSILLKDDVNTYKEPDDDMREDTSRYVFSIAGHYCNVMEKLMKSSWIRNIKADYNDREKAVILHAAIKDRVPQREKNTSRRGNMTWLMQQCCRCVASHKDEERSV